MKDKKGLITLELEKFEIQINEIEKSLESIKLFDIEDPEDRLKATIAKQSALKNHAGLLDALYDLRKKDQEVKEKSDNSKLSPLENR